MLYQAKIVNFKRISEAGIFLKNLSQINYFIGENGSGKSSILQALYGFYAFNPFPSINLPPIIENKNIWVKAKKDYKVLYINDNTPALLNFALDFFSKTYSKPLEKLDQEKKSLLSSVDFIDFRKKLQDELVEKYNYLDWGLFSFDREQGIKDSQNHLATINQIFNTLPYKPDLVLIETPEGSLHPSLEKTLPKIFQEIAISLGCQMFIATHSPFVVSSSGNLEDEQRDGGKIYRKEYRAGQKVYLIKDGQTASKRGELGVKESGLIYGSDGYWGKKVGYIAAKMLGTGLQDFIVKLDETPTKTAPTLIFCEGQGKDEDARIYNQIFKEKEPRVMFVSSRGSSQTEFSFDILEDIKDGLSGNFKILMLRDRDHEFPTIWNLIENQEKYPNHRVLFRRAIECYIYTSQAAENLLNSYHLALPPVLKNQIDILQRKIQAEAEHGKLGDDYKERLIILFRKVARIGNKEANFFDFEEFKFALVKSITPNSEIYYHLEKDIFVGFRN